VFVRVCSEYDCTERPHQEACPEGHQGEHQGQKWVAAWEEGFADGGSVVAKYHEVIHLQKISAGDANHRPDFRAAIRSADHGSSSFAEIDFHSIATQDNQKRRMSTMPAAPALFPVRDEFTSDD
jgi:hypothetical protein